MIAGFLAGITTTMLIHPTDTIKTRCQRNSISIIECVRSIYGEGLKNGGKLKAIRYFWTGTVSHAIVVGVLFGAVQVRN